MKTFLLGLIAAFVLLPCVASADVSPGTYSIPSDVSGGVQNLRAGPGQGHRIVVPIPAGAGGVEIGECRSADDGRSRYDWCRARWNGNSGWISSCCLVAEREQSAPPQQQPTPAAAPAEIREPTTSIEGSASLFTLDCVVKKSSPRSLYHKSFKVTISLDQGSYYVFDDGDRTWKRIAAMSQEMIIFYQINDTSVVHQFEVNRRTGFWYRGAMSPRDASVNGSNGECSKMDATLVPAPPPTRF